jgi:FkbM family methyltransferase
MSSIKQFVKSHRTLNASLGPAIRLARSARPSKRARLAKAAAEMFEAVEGGSLIVRVPDFHGSFESDARSHMLRRILIDGKYEPEVVDLIKKRLDRNRDAIDVGANVGLFTVLLAKLLSSGRVLAIEPTPGALHYLRRNLERNNCRRNVVVFEGAASNSADVVVLKVISGKEEYSSSGDLAHPSIRNEPYGLVRAAGDTVDGIVEKLSMRPGFIKVDTEGSEYEVLLGCERTMSTYRPVVLCECWDDHVLTQSGGVPGAVSNLLRARGYTVSRPIQGELLAIPEEAAQSTGEPL